MKNTISTTLLFTAIMALSGPTSAQAANTINSTVTMSLPVNSPVCTIINSSNSIALPTASYGQGIVSYAALNFPLKAPSVPAGTQLTSTTLNQTATISCNQANTLITSFLVKPGPNASFNPTAQNSSQWLVDATMPTPVKLLGLPTLAEQVSVNNTITPFIYWDSNNNGNTLAYTTPFQTGALSTGANPVSTATVVWRPTFYVAAPITETFGTPVGGSYNGSFQIVVNY